MLPPPPTEDELAAVLESPVVVEESPVAMEESPVAMAPAAIEDSGYQEEEWVEHRNKDGRKYWYNTQTRISTWEQPPVMFIRLFVCQPPVILVCLYVTILCFTLYNFSCP